MLNRVNGEVHGESILNFDYSWFVNDCGYDLEICTKCTDILYEFFLRESYNNIIQYLLFSTEYWVFDCAYFELFDKAYECIFEGIEVEDYELYKVIIRLFVDVMNSGEYKALKGGRNYYGNRFIPYFDGEEKKFYIIDRKV